MKLLALHGPAIESSRKKLGEIKSKFDFVNIVVFDPSADSGQVLDTLQTVSLFNGEQLIILENPEENFLDQLSVVNDQLTIVLWFDKEVDPNKFSNAQVFFFPEAKEVSVFPLLRLLGGRKVEAFIEMKKLKKAGFENQYFITMILYLLRNLVATPKKAAEFVRRNNEVMRKNFTKDELVNLYKNILEIDFKIKKGLLEDEQAEFDLVKEFLRF